MSGFRIHPQPPSSTLELDQAEVSAARAKGSAKPGGQCPPPEPDFAEKAGALLRRGRPWIPPLASWLALGVGLVNIFSALTPEIHYRIKDVASVLPGSFVRSATALTVVSGVLLVLLSRGLRRRKRRAWRAAVFLLGASIGLHIAKGLDVEEALIAALLFVGLIVYRDEFRAKGDPTTRWRALGVGLFLVALSLLLGMLLLQFRRSHIVGPASLGQQFHEVVFGLVGVGGPLSFTTDRTSDLVARVLFAMGLLVILSVVYLILRPPEPRPVLTTDDEARVRELLRKQGGRDSLGYFALRRDKSVVWSPSGKACISYRVLSGVMLASGDPLGDPEAWPGAVTAFLQEAAEHAWTPACLGCSETGGLAYQRAGLSAWEIGDEAVVEVPDFSLEGRPMRNVRQAVNRVERAGYSVRVCRVSELSEDEKDDIRRQASAWRTGDTERGFSMALGRFGNPGDGECVVVMAVQHHPERSPCSRGDEADGTAETPNGLLRGFMQFVPWGKDGLSLDLMRRDQDADNGINEFLIVSALRAAPDLGVRRLSLNFAVFRSALERGERLGAGPVLRAWRRVLLLASRWVQIESLYRFNAKFRPLWEPRYLCYPRAGDLPRVAVAALEAEAFISWPRPRLPGPLQWLIPQRSALIP
jgi:lysyl-tRNA synthetase class 2